MHRKSSMLKSADVWLINWVKLTINQLKIFYPPDTDSPGVVSFTRTQLQSTLSNRRSSYAMSTHTHTHVINSWNISNTTKWNTCGTFLANRLLFLNHPVHSCALHREKYQIVIKAPQSLPTFVPKQKQYIIITINDSIQHSIHCVTARSTR